MLVLASERGVLHPWAVGDPVTNENRGIRRLKPGFATALYVTNITITIVLNIIYIMLKSFIHHDTNGEGSLDSVRKTTRPQFLNQQEGNGPINLDRSYFLPTLIHNIISILN